MIEIFKTPQGRMWVGLIALVALVGIAFAVTSAIKKAIARAGRPADTPPNQVATINQDGTITAGSGTPQDLAGFEPRVVGDRLLEVLRTSYWFDASPRCEAYEAAYRLTDNQLKAVANYFKNRHPQGKTVAAAMADTTSDGCRYVWGYSNGYGDLLRDKMQRLNIP